MAKNTEAYIKERKDTLELMIGIYCRRKHGSSDLCIDCRELFEYACHRVDLCPNNESRGTCKKCEHPCYTPEMRSKIKEVMRFSGPRMIAHPVKLISYKLR